MKKEFLHGDDFDKLFFDQELNDIILGDNEDPRVISKQIAKVLIKFSFTLSDPRRVRIIRRCAMTEYSAVLATGTTMFKMTKGRNPYSFELMELLVADWKMRKGPLAECGQSTETSLANADRTHDRNLGTANHNRRNGNRDRSCWKCGSNDHIRNECPLLN